MTNLIMPVGYEVPTREQSVLGKILRAQARYVGLYGTRPARVVVRDIDVVTLYAEVCAAIPGTAIAGLDGFVRAIDRGELRLDGMPVKRWHHLGVISQ